MPSLNPAKRVELLRENGSPFITLFHDEDEGLVFADWNGFLTVEMVMEGSEALLDLFRQVGDIDRVLINNQKVLGPWHKANEWYGRDWNPRAVQAGLRYMAVILSANLFTQLSLKGYEQVSSGFVVSSFDTEGSAREWLKSKN